MIWHIWKEEGEKTMTARTVWPELPLEEWKDTYATLHMWTQIIGKIKLALTPPVNHWWNSTLYVTPRGLTTGPMFYNDQPLQIDFDFISNLLLIITTDNPTKSITIGPCSVADFHQEVMDALKSLGMPVTIWTTPVEVQDQTPFDKDHKHASYDPKYVRRLWFILSQATRVLLEFRSWYIGKASPVHFFWGAFDLAVTRFSGRPAPQHAGVPNCPRHVMIEAYSHEVSSCGFWPGGGPVSEPVFYAYAYPEPEGFKNYPVQPAEAFYHMGMSEFLLPYEKVRIAKSPDDILLSFLQSTYEAEATLAKWDRGALERH